jgi:hypothetical protein
MSLDGQQDKIAKKRVWQQYQQVLTIEKHKSF